MTAPTLISPNTGNLRVGKGKCEFMREGSVLWTHLGNCTSVEFTPTIGNLEHFTSLEGLKLKDVKIALTLSGAIKVVMEEFTPFNLALMAMGSVDEGASGGPTITILSEESINGQFRFTSNNRIGPRVNMLFYNVSITPSGAIQGISEEWGNMEVSMETLISQDAPHIGNFGIMQVTNIDS